MHNILIKIHNKEVTTSHPENWEELTQEQFINISNSVQDGKLTQEARCNIINMFLGVQDPLMEFPKELVILSDFLIKIGSSHKNLVPSIKFRKKSDTLYGPSDYLRNVTIAEFAFMERNFMATQGIDESGEWINLIRSLCDGDLTKLDKIKDILLHNVLSEMESRLKRAASQKNNVLEKGGRKNVAVTKEQRYDYMCKMIAVVYRNAKEGDFDEWDPRVVFDEKEINKRAFEIRSMIDDKTKYAILLNYKMIRKWLEKRYQIVFQPN